MFNFFDISSKQLKQFDKQISKINFLESEFSKLSEREIKERVNQLILKYQIIQNFDDILVESFALTREAAKRTLGLRHFDTQLLAGIILHQGKIAEMKTGEGKTLAATLSVVLNALSLKGVHVVTVNDYLAKRDKQTMGQIYRYLGLSVGLIQENMGSDERRKNYAADITYVTNSELAFDYLRDNMVKLVNDFVLRDFNYCIIDEVDSILIDEARTPLIISGNLNTPIEKYVIADEICNYLKFKTHYLVDEKAKNITLTNQGITQVQRLLDVPNLYDVNDPWIPYLNNALKAKNLFIKDVNYIVKDNEIIIVDEFSGRIMADRRWGEGLHQAVEAKENVPIKKGSETLGSVTYQNFFLAYPKFAGMTGTAKTAEAEFESIYKSSVVVIPTSKKMVRNDLPDYVFKDDYSRWKALASFVEETNKIGRPILIGTTTIERSEIISTLLNDLQISHRLLNAKPENVKRESEIVAQAGRKYAVTVSTNMAGRGTDILLGGNPDFQTRQQIFFFIKNFKKSKIYLSSIKKICLGLSSTNLKSLTTNLFLCQFELALIYRKFLRFLRTENISYGFFLDTLSILNSCTEKDLELLIINLKENGYVNKKSLIQLYFDFIYDHFYKKNKLKSESEKRFVKYVGGLYVIGTERHESRRIDNQLRGRAGRQGDPGTSKFFVSIDDNLFRIFGEKQLKSRLATLYTSDDRPLESEFFSKTLESCQKKVEDLYYDSRKRLFDYDEVVNFQRRAIYRERKALLKNLTIRPEVITYGEDLIVMLAQELKSLNLASEKVSFNTLNNEISYLLGINYLLLDYKECSLLTLNQVTMLLLEQFWLTYDLKEAEFDSITPYLIRLVEKTVVLNRIDLAWKLHLQKAELLRETIGWRGYGQLDPLQEYKNEGFNLFIETIREIKYNSIYDILKAQSIL
jgi:preprotein translocase subunit SecA